MSRPLIVKGCACSGTLALIMRGECGLFCGESGADERALLRYASGLEVLEQMPLRDLEAAFVRRTSYTPDLGLSSQICPRCSTTDVEAFGEFSRKEGRFWCRECQLILPLATYERELEEFERHRWRALRDLRELKALEVSSL